MPSLRSEWHDRVKAVENEFRLVRVGVERLRDAVAHDPTVLSDGLRQATLSDAASNLEGTYLVRLFAEFESALRSSDRARHNDPTRDTKASTLIDQIGGRRGRDIPPRIRQGAHAVREARNRWAHEGGAAPEEMSLAAARARLQSFLSELPDQWG